MPRLILKSPYLKPGRKQDLLQIYQKQTDFRDKLRHESKDQMERIVAEINAGNFSDPVLEQMLLQLSKKLFQSKGRKQYGYLKPEVKKLVDEIVSHLSGEEHIRELYGHWYDLKEDVLRTCTDTFPERIPLEQNKEFKSIRNAVVQYALQIQLSPEDAHRFGPPSSEPVPPPVDFPDDERKVYAKAVKFLHDPTVPPTPQLERFYHEAAIRGSVDAVYAMGKVNMKKDTQKAIGFFELAAANKTQETSKIPLVKSKLFQGIKTPPYVVASHPQHMVVRN